MRPFQYARYKESPGYRVAKEAFELTFPLLGCGIMRRVEGEIEGSAKDILLFVLNFIDTHTVFCADPTRLTPELNKKVIAAHVIEHRLARLLVKNIDLEDFREQGCTLNNGK